MQNESPPDSNREQKLLVGRIKAKLYYAKYGEKVRAKRRARYAANPAQDLERTRLWMKNNPDKTFVHQQRYYAKHIMILREKARIRMAKLRARRRAENAM